MKIITIKKYSRPKENRHRKIIILAFAFLVAAAGALFFLFHSSSPVKPGKDAVSETVPVNPIVDIQDGGTASESPEQSFKPSCNVVAGQIDHTIYGSFINHFNADSPEDQLIADQLAAHFKRLFFFDVDFISQPRPGDRYAFVWKRTEEASDGIRIVAARFESCYHNKTFEAFYFKNPEEPFGRHYNRQGVDVQKRLRNSPVADYEQVTSLLNDRKPRHDGVDFKAPVGTPVTMPFDGEVLKLAPRGKRGNGIYIKVRYRRSGLIAYFLHLSKLEKGINTGRRLKARDKIGEVGNTGRSFAPHLHYQIETAGKKVLDPYYIHGSTRGTISQSARKSFEETVSEYDQTMDLKQI